jgi:hypothetical protein
MSCTNSRNLIRKNDCRLFTHFIRGGINILDKFFKSDEAWFHTYTLPHTLEEIKQNIEVRISKVTAKTLHRVVSKMRKRVNACIAERGGHFQHLI